MKHWLETSDSPYAIMMEDDCSLDLIRFWNFSWVDFYAHAPYDWDVIQLAIICTGDIHVKLHKRFVNDFSTACYMITRHHAEKLLRYHCRGDKYKLDNGCKPRAVADDLIYNSGNTYAIPLLLYKTELELHRFIQNILVHSIKETSMHFQTSGNRTVPILTSQTT